MTSPQEPDGWPPGTPFVKRYRVLFGAFLLLFVLAVAAGLAGAFGLI